MNILLLSYVPAVCADTIIEHVNAIKGMKNHNVVQMNYFGGVPNFYDIRESIFDCIIIHYSLIAISKHYINSETRKKIRAFKGLKLAIIQDEYRWVNKTVRALFSMRIKGILTVCDNEVASKLYQTHPRWRFVIKSSLTGFVNLRLLEKNVPPYAERPIDIGYRSRKLPYSLGQLSQEKYLIASGVRAALKQTSLKLDISVREEDRMYGESWFNFIKNCKAMLGTESGASIIDFEDNIVTSISAFCAENPDATFEDAIKNVPNNDGELVIATISPRVFESAALRTLMILYEGHYSGILTPYRHYVPLKKDHSNLAEVLNILNDSDRATKIISAAYTEIAQNPKYWPESLESHINELIDMIILAEGRPKRANTGLLQNYLRLILFKTKISLIYWLYEIIHFMKSYLRVFKSLVKPSPFINIGFKIKCMCIRILRKVSFTK